MLVLSRRPLEASLIRRDEGGASSLSRRDLFAQGPIEIMLFGTDGNRFRVGISAPKELSIWRKDNDV